MHCKLKYITYEKYINEKSKKYLKPATVNCEFIKGNILENDKGIKILMRPCFHEYHLKWKLERRIFEREFHLVKVSKRVGALIMFTSKSIITNIIYKRFIMRMS